MGLLVWQNLIGSLYLEEAGGGAGIKASTSPVLLSYHLYLHYSL